MIVPVAEPGTAPLNVAPAFTAVFEASSVRRAYGSVFEYGAPGSALATLRLIVMPSAFALL